MGTRLAPRSGFSAESESPFSYQNGEVPMISKYTVRTANIRKSVNVGVLGIHRDTQNGYPMNDTGTIRTGKKSFDSVIPVLVQQSLTETSVLHTM